MAKMRLNYHPNTIEENESILQKISTGGKVINKTLEEWYKMIANLNFIQRKRVDKKLSKVQQDKRGNEYFYGPILEIIPGHCWKTRLDCSKDGVHIPQDKNIQKGPFGVTSICTPHISKTNDVDLGTYLTFTGDEYISDEKSNDSFRDNLQHAIPIRVVRSSNRKNEFAPKTGYRYDGLYIITSSWISVSSNSKKFYKYTLTRLNCQEPPSWSTSPSTMSSLSSLSSSSSSSSPSLSQSSANQPDRLSFAPFKSSIPSNNCFYKLKDDKCEGEKVKLTDKKLINEDTYSLKPQVNSTNDNIQKNSCTESTIIMRHISKKYNSLSSLSNADSPVLNTNKVLPLSPAEFETTSDTKNSLELYDSSPNLHQNLPDKAVSMTLCRIYKANVTPVKMINRNSNCTNKISEVEITVTKTVTPENLTKAKNLPVSTKRKSVDDNSNVNSKKLALRSSHNVTSDFSNSESKDRKCLQNDCLNGLANINNNNINNDRLNEQINNVDKLEKTQLDIGKSSVPEESISPEKMLKLILEKRYNPTGKFLIRNVIGVSQDSKPNDDHIDDSDESKNKYDTLKVNTKTSLKKSNANNRKVMNKSLTKSSKRVYRITGTARELSNLIIDANFGVNDRINPIHTRKSSVTRQLRNPNIRKRKDYPDHILSYPRRNKETPKKNLWKMITKSTYNTIINNGRRRIESSKQKSSSDSEPETNNSREDKKTQLSKVEMVDAWTQYFPQKDASTSVDDHVDLKKDSENKPESIVKVISPEKTKSFKSSNDVFFYKSSAFVPIKISDVASRVARLRSIGFKPIEPQPVIDCDNRDDNFQSKNNNSTDKSTSKSCGSHVENTKTCKEEIPQKSGIICKYSYNKFNNNNSKTIIVTNYKEKPNCSSFLKRDNS